MDGATFSQSIRTAYAEVVQWRRNVFKVPSGKAGKAFVAELGHLLRAYAEGSTQESIALMCAMTMPALLLQKPHKTSKAKDHGECLERRMEAWKKGDILILLHEGRTKQSQLLSSKRDMRVEAQTAPTVARLIHEGKIKPAIRMLTDRGSGGKLNLDDYVAPTGGSEEQKTVRQVLLEKHPKGRPLQQSTLFGKDTPSQEPHPVMFEQINGNLIHATALKTEGAAGPSGMDAAGWRRLVSSFHKESVDLCEAMAMMARRICSKFVDPMCLTAFTACRLVALDKHPGVRPVGIGEVLRRIIGKAILAVVGQDVQQVTGALQVCAGQQAGCESAVHAMGLVFQDSNTEAVLLADASNAFNCLNRQAALQNVLNLCPSIAPALVNTYRSNAHLFVEGEVILSEEGTTQGDPLAMAMYAIATIPLIHQLSKAASAKQVWFADDATAGGHIQELKRWWDRLETIGPDFGYHVNAAKSWLIVKGESLAQAKDIFGQSRVQITVEGQRHLGATLGTLSFTEAFVTGKVSEWVCELKQLTEIASTQPQAAYAALTHGLMSRWMYVARTIPNISDLLMPLEEVIRHQFLPALTGRRGITDEERDLFALPCRLGGLGIPNPTKVAGQQTVCELTEGDCPTDSTSPPTGVHLSCRGDHGADSHQKKN